MDYQGEFSGPQIDARLRLAESAYQKPATGIPATDLAEGVQEALQEAGTAYQKPANGIPASDLAEGVQESLQRGDSAYQKPVDGIPASDLAEGVQESLTRANTAYQKPSSGIPKTDLSEGVQQSLDNGDNALSGVNGILPLIPSAASALNKLADQALVQHLVQLMQASFCENWDEWASVPSVAGDFPKIPDNNDYLVVLNASDYAPLYNGDATYNSGDIRTYNGLLYKALQDDFSGILPTDTDYWEEVSENPKYAGSWIFKYVPVDENYNKYNWFPEFKISDVPFTQEQMASIDSGINALLVAKLTNLPVKPVDTAANQGLTDTEKANARANIGATAPEVFVATFGVTTAAEIDAAFAANKIIIVLHNDRYYYFSMYNTSNYGAYTFTLLLGVNKTSSVTLKRLTDSWTYQGEITIEETSNRATSWGTTPSNNKYPSEKLVYDSIYVKGVISQTQTWTQAADGGYDYVMSGIVQGNIPKANIDLFESAGATFNAVTGYFELNGLTDLSYEEMQKIYTLASACIEFRPDRTRQFYDQNVRTLYPIKAIGTAWATNLSACFQGSNVETVQFTVDALVNNISQLYRVCSYAKSLGAMNLGNIASQGDADNAFLGASSLESVYLKSLKVAQNFASCPRLSNASILYMINNEAATSAITITLHATAYARAMADADITAALTNHPNVSLASA
jgi:hypothetical protein